jgi:hypothetical protein
MFIVASYEKILIQRWEESNVCDSTLCFCAAGFWYETQLGGDMLSLKKSSEALFF